MDIDQFDLEAAINQTYPGPQMFVRDANPGPLAEKYEPGRQLLFWLIP